MAGQDVFKGALGWDDWIWWTGIGGVALFFLLTLLCCCVCVQRAKRKGRAEALAAVQARQREEQQREDAQVRYAQAQQARYPAPTPAQERDYKYSQQQGGSPAGVPMQMGPQGGVRKSAGPQVMANAGYAVPPPVPPQQYAQQQQQYGHYNNQQQQYGHPQQQQYGRPQQQQYGHPQQQYQYAAAPSKQQQQQQQQQNYYQQQQQQQPQYAAATAPEPPQPPAQNNYTRKAYNKPKPWHQKATPDAPYVVETSFSSSTHSEDANRSLHGASDDVPFVAVTSPSGRDTGLSASKIGGVTLRDRIDALREGSVHENHTRISVDTQDGELPPIGAGRRSLVLMGTVLSEQSESSDSPTSASGHLHDAPAPVFKTARSTDSSNDYSSSEFSSAVASQPFTTGQFDDAMDTYGGYKDAKPAATGGRNRIKSDDSRVSVEF